MKKILLNSLSTICLFSFSILSVAELDPVITPNENPITETKRVLGKILFWDEQLSSDNTVACGTCHRPSAGGSDPRLGENPGPDGVFNTDDDLVGSPGIARLTASGHPVNDPLFGFEAQVTGRASPSFIAAMYADSLFWDGRATSQFLDPQDNSQVIIASGGALESQAVGPILSSVEMAHEDRTWQEVIDKLAQVQPLVLASNIPTDMANALRTNSNYAALFNAAFGDSDITAARIGMAIATYERTLVPDQTPWDLYMAGDDAALTSTQTSGWEMLRDNTVCLNCHTPPLFSDNKFYNIGLRPAEDDLGLENTTGLSTDRGRFRTPTLRNVGLRKALMHTGGITDVMDAIDFYNANTDDLTSDHVQFTEHQTAIPTENNVDVDYSTLSLASSSENMQANIADFLGNALTDPRVETEIYPFDRPMLASERLDGSNPSIINIMTYNVSGLNLDSTRADLIAETIDAQMPDVIGLQEGGAIPLPDLESRLSVDYDFYTFAETTNNSNPILIKKNRFDIIASGTTDVNDMLSCVRERYINYVVLEELVSRQRFTVYNTQFCAQSTSVDNLPEGYTAEEVNQSHASSLVAAISENTIEYGGAALVVGDLNANSNTDTMAFLLEQTPLASGETNATNLDDTWALVNEEVKIGIDWILMLAGSANPLSSSVIDNATTQSASDHLPVIASIQLVSNQDAIEVIDTVEVTPETKTVSPSAKNVVIAKFSLQSDDDSNELHSITLQAEGSGDESESVSAVRLYVDENNDGVVDSEDFLIGRGSYQTNNERLLLSADNSYGLAAGTTVFLVVYDF